MIKNYLAGKAMVSGFVFLFTISTFLMSCNSSNQNSVNTNLDSLKKGKMELKKEAFGKVAADGNKEAYLFTLQNDKGLVVKLTNYGGIITSLIVPDKNGTPTDVVLGFDSFKDYTCESYIKSCPYFGAIIGRYGNRIAKAQFTIDGKTYKLAANNGENQLHGGLKGFDKVVWDAQEIKTDSTIGVKMSYLSKDGEENYPGNLSVSVTFTISNNRNELKTEFEATTDKTTTLNLTHHSYFNLAGAGTSDVLNTEMFINADRYVVVNDKLIPTGELRAVKGTDMDFTTAQTIVSRLAKIEGGGYDHTYVLNKKDNELSLVARAFQPANGVQMEVYTTEPGAQFYTGNFLDGTKIGKGGKAYQAHYGFCLETQHFPDSPNQPKFPSTILKPNEKYYQLTVYKFSTQ